MEIKERIEAAPMKKLQIVVIAVCLALNMIDGFDVLVMAFSAPALTQDWKLSGGELGMLLSSALFGMALGSMVISQIADIIGRRRTILICATIISAGMLASAFAPDYATLIVARFVTGLAIGTMQACLNVFVSEYSSARRRTTAISIYAAGQTLGGIFGGIIAGVLITQFGWRSAFLFGAVVTALMIPVIAGLVPESIDFLLARRPGNALPKLNAILVRLDQPTVEELPQRATSSQTARTRWKDVLLGSNSTTTLLLSVAFFMVMGSFYFANSWTPKLISAGGFSVQDGITAGVLFSTGGLVGTVAFGLIAAKSGVARLLIVTFVLGGGAFVVYALSTGALPSALLAAALLGLLLAAGIAGMFSIGPIFYSSDVRATAVGFITGMGRVGAIVSPIAAGLLIDAHWAPGDLYYLFIIPMAIGGLAIFAVRNRKQEITRENPPACVPVGGKASTP